MDFTTLSLDDLLGYDLSTLDVDGLTALQAEIRTRFEAIRAEETPTPEQVQEGLSLHRKFGEAKSAKAALTQAATDAATLTELSLEEEEEEGQQPPEGEPEGEGTEGEGAEEATETTEASAEEVVAEAEAVTAAAAHTTPRPVRAVARLAGTRPASIPSTESLVTITAAADTQFATGSEISLAQLGEAAIDRLKALPVPDGAEDDGPVVNPERGEDLRMFRAGQVAVPYPAEVQINNGMDEEQIQQALETALDQSRIPGESLVAANGWCAPSETIYDLCAGEVVDGILSVAEVQVNRGGFKHTTGIDFSTIYSGVGFLQTEAQAIAGTAKASYEVPCPTFVDERLDAIGLYLKVPILLEVGYPEAVARVMSASMIAHQYKVNASVIARILTIAGAALDPTPDFASATGELLNTLDLEATILRQKYRLGVKAAMEVVLPVFGKEVIRNELGLRNGRGVTNPVTDEEINAHFAARNYNVQWVWGWQELAGTELTWPATVEFLMYPAGTLVKGVSNVINLNAVYDAASLSTNLYTGLFYEQGLLVAKMCYEVRRATVPVTGAFTGKTGAASL